VAREAPSAPSSPSAPFAPFVPFVPSAPAGPVGPEVVTHWSEVPSSYQTFKVASLVSNQISPSSGDEGAAESFVAPPPPPALQPSRIIPSAATSRPSTVPVTAI